MGTFIYELDLGFWSGVTKKLKWDRLCGQRTSDAAIHWEQGWEKRKTAQLPFLAEVTDI